MKSVASTTPDLGKSRSVKWVDFQGETTLWLLSWLDCFSWLTVGSTNFCSPHFCGDLDRHRQHLWRSWDQQLRFAGENAVGDTEGCDKCTRRRVRHHPRKHGRSGLRDDADETQTSCGGDKLYWMRRIRSLFAPWLSVHVYVHIYIYTHRYIHDYMILYVIIIYIYTHVYI